jgi:lipopolysaccharide/colanic/teichoic acid biosynthesis glycosyltransferase
MPASSKNQPLRDLMLVTIGFVSALAVHQFVVGGGLSAGDAVVGTGLSILAFWLALQLKTHEGEDFAGSWVVFLEQFCLGAGINLLLHALMTYGFQARRTPFLVLAGSFASAALVALQRKYAASGSGPRERVLLVGSDETAQAVIGSMVGTVVAYVAEPGLSRSGEAPHGAAVELNPEQVEQYIASARPTHILIGTVHWRDLVTAETLVRAKMDGIAVEEAPVLYEHFFSRVSCTRIRPMDFLLSPSLRGDARTMAIQAVYNNLMGLSLLLVLSPLMLVVACALWAAKGSGSVMESVRCAGFQYIPFRLYRFRTSGSSGPTTVGRVVEKLGLTNLPNLLNVVRGEMALVGPKPVREEFANLLTEAMPFYSHRFSVQPGLVGWAQTQAGPGVSETEEIEYDLFYIKQGSLWMDVEIIAEQIFGRRAPRKAA